MVFLYEEYKFSKFQDRPKFQDRRNIAPSGWARTFLLAIGAGAGVIATHILIHTLKRGRPERGPRGPSRTLLLAGGATTGVLATAGIIHLHKQAVMRDPYLKEI